MRSIPSVLIALSTAILLPNLAWSACKDSTPSATPSRFELKEAHVLDHQTGLTWMRCSIGKQWDGQSCTGDVQLMNLAAAQEAAKKQGQGWQVPTIEQLHSLVIQPCNTAAIDTHVFPDVEDLGDGAPYWSQTPIASLPGLIYYIDFMDGAVDGHSAGFSLALRLVQTHPIAKQRTQGASTQ
ncbi:DUF1566 domain-containing protein [Lampropedia puyangensis]|nr:DUF1566 domain-containing protein [Lampropedia puyangensis]